jgi:flagellum-specific peptidoglycan hydrolase FlgJ
MYSYALHAEPAENVRMISYIEQYKYLAIQEMHRTQIPASIKLAQAILESQAGSSLLAIKANNHFGIKCGDRWTGGTYYLKDDDYDKHGNHIQSCFRAYSDPMESFMAHSNLLPGKAE